MKKELLGSVFATGLFVTGCGDDGTEAKKQDEPKAVNDGVESRDDESFDVEEGFVFDKDWDLKSITVVGESDVTSFGNADYELLIYKFNFQLGETAVSCLVTTDSDNDFSDSPVLDPSLCFVDGDISQPLTDIPPR